MHSANTKPGNTLQNPHPEDRMKDAGTSLDNEISDDQLGCVSGGIGEDDTLDSHGRSRSPGGRGNGRGNSGGAPWR